MRSFRRLYVFFSYTLDNYDLISLVSTINLLVLTIFHFSLFFALPCRSPPPRRLGRKKHVGIVGAGCGDANELAGVNFYVMDLSLFHVIAHCIPFYEPR